MRGRPSPRQGGYVLIMVLGALVLIALVAARFAQRIDGLRSQTGSLQAHAQQRLAMGNALAAALYVTTTHALGPAGVGPPIGEPVLRADDRLYRLPDGGEVQVQDARGLLPLNVIGRPQLRSVLASLGVGVAVVDAWIDVLQDYQDIDSLKRLNGAETGDYAALGLAPPRNDWLVSVRELNRLPLWRDQPGIVEAMERLGSTNRLLVFNPNTASIELLRLLLPTATPVQLELFDTLRRRAAFTSSASAQRATGLPFQRDEFIFHLGQQLRLTVSASGAARALQYNVTIVPGGAEAPWLISEAHPVVHRSRDTPDTPDRATPFPLADPKTAKP